MLQSRLAALRLREAELPRAHGAVQLVLDLVHLRRPRVALGPQVARVARVTAELEADQVILLEVAQPTAERVRADLPLLERVRVVDRRADRPRPAAAADRRADRRLRDV